MTRIFFALVFVAGCTVERASEHAASAPPADTVAIDVRNDSVLCVQPTNPQNTQRPANKGRIAKVLPSDRELIQMLRAAYHLERELYDSTRSFANRDAVLAHYRLGFSESVAQRLTDYSWSSDSSILRCCREAIMVAPDTAAVVSKTASAAAVVYVTPSFLQDRWGFGPYGEDELKMCNGRWLVAGSKELENRPRELDARPAA
jgi:hypothetical protein